MSDKTFKSISLVIMALFFLGFVYLTAKAIQISNKTQIGLDDGVYTNAVRGSKEIESKALELTHTCKTELCQVQSLLDYVTGIPYKVNHFRANSPQKTIQNYLGDCDDKSNLLISMLHALKKEAYFVLVPNHIFVITPINDKRLSHLKGLFLDDKKYFILEGTAEGSKVGYPLHYRLKDISAIIEPFSNEKYHYEHIRFE